MAFVLRPPGALDTLPERLGVLGRDRRRAAVLAECFRLVAITLASVLVVAAVDQLIHLPGAVRVLGLAAILTVLGLLALAGLRQASRMRTHPLDVALVLEKQFPRLNDALASAVSFLTIDESTNTRPGGTRFRSVAVRHAETVSRRLDLDSIVNSGRAWRWFWAAVLVGAVAFGGAALDPYRAGISMVRLADPYGNHPYPTRTTIEVQQPTASSVLLAKGSPFTIRFLVRGEIPPTATIALRRTGGAEEFEDVAIPTEALAEDVDAREITATLESGRVADDFEFRILANDAVTEWWFVDVEPPPKLVPRAGRPSPQIRLEYPEYTDLPAVDLPDGAGVVEAVAGTRFTFRAAADRAIATAAFHYEEDRTALDTASVAAAFVSASPLGIAAAMRLADESLAPIPVQITGDDRSGLDAEFVPPLPGLYSLRFTDTVGLTGVRLFNFETFSDPSPVVTLTRPNPATDPLILLPTASVTLQTRAEDRTFGVKSLHLEYRVGPDGDFRTLPLTDLQRAGRFLPAVAGSVPLVQPKPVGLDSAVTLPVAVFRKSDGTLPADGDSITLRTAATDWDSMAWTKLPGRSEEITLRILSRSSVEAMLQKELAGMRPELLRQREAQREARKLVDEVAGALKTQELPPAEVGKLARAEQTQRQIRNVVTDPAAGIRSQAERLRQTVRANGLPKSPTTERLDAVADELARLAEQHLEAAEPTLAEARMKAELGSARSAADREQLSELLERSRKHQRAAETGLDAALERLEEWAGAGEVRGQARALKSEIHDAGTAADRERPPTGTPSAKLTPAEQAALDGAADRFEQLADQAGGLVGKAARLAAEKDRKSAELGSAADEKIRQAAKREQEAADEPPGSEAAAEKRSQAEVLRAEAEAFRLAADKTAREATALREALEAAGGQALPRDLREAADALRKNQPDRSAAARADAAERLDRFADGLTEQPGRSTEELQRDRSDAADELHKLGEAQDELRKKANAAAAIPDPQERAKALEELAREQNRLRRKAEIIAQKLTRQRSDAASDAARQAMERMDAARQQLEAGQVPTEDQEATLDRLDEALDRLETEQKQTEEQLSREQREELSEQLKSFRDRQAASVAEAIRLQTAATEAKRWDRPLLASLADLEDRERDLAEELRRFVEAKLAEAPVFSRLASQAADAMDRAADLAAERRDDLLTADPDDPFDPELEKASGDRVRRPMDTALRRLEQILSAVVPEQKKPEVKNPDQPPGEPMPPPETPPPEAEPPSGTNPAAALAQLKALRAVQAEVNEHTAAFAKAHPDPETLTDDDREELKELERTQRDIAELFDQLADTFRSAPEVP